jgi:hypothetical protein
MTPSTPTLWTPGAPSNLMDSGRCTSKSKQSGERCRNHPRPGSTVCHIHGGKSPQVRRVAARRVAIMEAQRIVQGLGGMVDVDPLDVLLEGVREAAYNVTVYRIAIESYPVVEAPKELLVKYEEWWDRAIRYAKVCVEAGVEERKVRLQEAEGALMARVVRAAVDACNPTGDERAAAVVAAGRELRAIGAGT